MSNPVTSRAPSRSVRRSRVDLRGAMREHPLMSSAALLIARRGGWGDVLNSAQSAIGANNDTAVMPSSFRERTPVFRDVYSQPTSDDVRTESRNPFYPGEALSPPTADSRYD